MKISLIIPVCRLDEECRQCLRSVAKCCPQPFETIIVLDGPVGGDIDGGDIQNLRIVRMPKNKGPAAARNEGAEIATGDVLFFLDADIVAQSDVCGRIAMAFLCDENLDALFGSYDDMPAHRDKVSLYRNVLHHYTHQHSWETAFTFWTGCGAVKKRSFQDAGGFDTRYRYSSIEDIEFGYRLVDHGKKIRLVKDLQVTPFEKMVSVGYGHDRFYKKGNTLEQADCFPQGSS